jgi:hypothetical protein
MSMIDGQNEIKVSWARWINSSGTYMRQAGMDNFMACLLSGDFGHAPRSKLYYAVVSKCEVWAAASAYFKQSGWGRPVEEPSGGIGFGSRAVSTQDGLRRATSWLRTEVASMRPARSDRNTAKLLEYHNRYTRLIGFELTMLLALREAKQYGLCADVDETADYWIAVSDKSTPGPEGAMPAPLCHRAKSAIRAYRVHCKAVADRLFSMGHGGSALYQRLRAIEQRGHVALLCMATGVETIRPAGSSDVIGVLPDDIRPAPDAGRKWLENALRHAGLRTGDVDGMLRHEVVGQSRSSSTSDFIVLEWAVRVAAAVDAASASILWGALPGLAKRAA